jgi:hypothetical protein
MIPKSGSGFRKRSCSNNKLLLATKVLSLSNVACIHVRARSINASFFFHFWTGAPNGELLQRITGTRRPWLAVGCDQFSLSIHFGPKLLGRLPELFGS